MTGTIPCLQAYRKQPIPGLPEDMRAPPVPVLLAKALPVLSGLRRNHFTGPAHSEFEILFGRGTVQRGIDAIIRANGSPDPIKVEAPRPRAAKPASAPRLAPGEVVAKVAEVLRKGGLWRDSDLASEVSVGVDTARHALRTLSEDRSAILVAVGHWRSRARHADLLSDGRNLAARMLGLCLVGLAIPVDELSDHLGVPLVEARDQAEALRNQGHLVRVEGGLYQCPLEVRERIVPAMGPSPLSELGTRMVDALACGRRLRKTDIAEAVGIGRGSSNRMVDRLVEEGWIVESDDGKFGLA